MNTEYKDIEIRYYDYRRDRYETVNYIVKLVDGKICEFADEVRHPRDADIKGLSMTEFCKNEHSRLKEFDSNVEEMSVTDISEKVYEAEKAVEICKLKRDDIRAEFFSTKSAEMREDKLESKQHLLNLYPIGRYPARRCEHCEDADTDTMDGSSEETRKKRVQKHIAAAKKMMKRSLGR